MKQIIAILALTAVTAVAAGLSGAACAETTTPASPPAATGAPATGHNVHKERDHRFKACKAEAKAAGIPGADFNAYVAACMKKAP